MGNNKLRITVIPLLYADGTHGPFYVILGHSKSSAAAPDQRRMLLVVKQLHTRAGFRVEDGWDYGEWTRELTIKNKRGQLVTETHWKSYIKHRVTGHVIISQVKAWNDTVTSCAHNDLIIKPERMKLGKLHLWMDRCGPHTTDAVSGIFDEIDVKTSHYAAATTSKVQVTCCY